MNESRNNKYDIIIIGAGITGLCIAHQAKKKNKNVKIAIIEKELESGFHTSGRNSGVLHAGIYYQENSLKASVCIKGARRLKKWINENDISINNCGKIIVAQNEKVADQIEILMKRSAANGVVTEQLSKQQLNHLCPLINPNACGGIWSPNTAVVNPKEVINVLTQQLSDNEVTFYYGGIISKFLPDKSSIILQENQILEYEYLFNCSGIFAEDIAKKYGVGYEYKVLPFKGLYWELKNPSRFNINTNIYPVPDLSVPFRCSLYS